MMLAKIVLTTLVAVLLLTPVTALHWTCYLCIGPVCWTRCYTKGRNTGRRLEIDPQQVIEETLASGEILSQNYELWQDTLELLAENDVATQEDLERLVFEGTQEENETLGLLEEVVLVTSIWQRLEEHIDTNDDGILSAEEWSAFKPQDVPLPSTPDAVKALLTRGEGTTAKAFSDFLTATVYYHPEIAEDDEPQGLEAEQLRSAKSPTLSSADGSS